MIEIKIVKNVFLNNIDLHDRPSRMRRFSPGVTNIFQIRKIQIFDKSDTDISDFIIECFNQNKSCQKLYFKQLTFQ